MFFYNALISCSTTIPGWNLWDFWIPAALAGSFFLGAFPPCDFLPVVRTVGLHWTLLDTIGSHWVLLNAVGCNIYSLGYKENRPATGASWVWMHLPPQSHHSGLTHSQAHMIGAKLIVSSSMVSHSWFSSMISNNIVPYHLPICGGVPFPMVGPLSYSSISPAYMR